MKVEFIILLVAVLASSVAGHDEKQTVEARGKAEFALLTNLGILLAAKVGLFKIGLGIALVIGTMKLLVILAWALAIFKYVPDPYIYYIHFFYVVAANLFVLKLIYGAIFYVLIVKGWHFVSWFIHYLKEKKQDHHEYVDYHEPYHNHDYGHHDHFEHDHHDPSYDPYRSYAHETQGYGSYKKMYDADGSYSIKS